MSINALPQTAIRALGASQALTDATSVIKELLDNSLDARATSVSIEIAANTLDVIQVRDNGHGIAPTDRPLVARRYCTSKIRHEKDLASIGGSSLGFRGEALSSAVDMSDSMTITTRVEGEDIASALKISQSGGVAGEDPASHPVGTTVRITNFLVRQPVRKQVALKGTAKTLAKIKQMLQAYAFARPETRLSVRVLKAKNNRDNWTYAPKPDGDIEDTALKVVGKPCVSQCAHFTTQSDGFTINAFIPKPDAVAAKVSSSGQYLSVDGRSVTSLRGTPKHIVKLFKEALKRDNDSMQGVKDPFMYLSIICPQDSYDANIEPAKDDVLFEEPDKVLNAVRELLAGAYPKQDANLNSNLPLLKPLRHEEPVEVDLTEVEEEPIIESRPKRVCTEKTNMYDLDKDDLKLFEDATEMPDNTLDEENQSSPTAAASSNPWTVAKMNASMGKRPVQQQLVTPVRQVGSFSGWPSSPAQDLQSSQQPYLPTPRLSSPRADFREQSPLFMDSRVIGSATLPPPRPHLNYSPARPYVEAEGLETRDQQFEDERIYNAESDVITRPPLQSQQHLQGTPLDQIPEVIPKQHVARRQPHQQGINKPFKPPVARGSNTEFVPPVFGRFGPSGRRAPTQEAHSSYLVPSGEPVDAFDKPRFLTPPVNNNDIRNFMRPKDNSMNRAETFNQHDDENTLPVGEHAVHSRTLKPAALLSGVGDFIPASRLGRDVPVNEEQPRSNTRPRRRRTSQGRVLGEVTGNGVVDDDPDYTETADKPQRRRTTDGNKAQQTKSAQLPLERVPEALQVHTLSVITSATTEGISWELTRLDVDRTFMAFNTRAEDCRSAFGEVSDADTMRWADSLQSLLDRSLSGEMVQDLHDLVRDACTFEVEPQSSAVSTV